MENSHKLIGVAFVTGLVIASSGCDESRVVAPIGDNFLIEGAITDIGTDLRDDGSLAILVEDPESITNYRSVIFPLTDDTLIQTSDPIVSLSVDDLAVGSLRSCLGKGNCRRHESSSGRGGEG